MTVTSEATYESAFSVLEDAVQNAPENTLISVNANSVARKCLESMEETQSITAPEVFITADGGAQFKWTRVNDIDVSLMIVSSGRIIEYQVKNVVTDEFIFVDVDPRNEEQFEDSLNWLKTVL